MFRTIAILLLLAIVAALLWPTILEGARMFRDRFKSAYEPPKSPDDKA